MKKITLFILAIIICGTAIAKHKHKKKQKPGGEIISVMMRRTACFGRCPDYKVEINKDGIAAYTGMRFVPDTGIFTKNIGTAKAMEVIDQFAAYRVDTCSNIYQNRIQDLPGMMFTIKYKDSTKTIVNANFGPMFFRELGETMDAAGKKTDDSWKKTGMPDLSR